MDSHWSFEPRSSTQPNTTHEHTTCTPRTQSMKQPGTPICRRDLPEVRPQPTIPRCPRFRLAEQVG